MAATQIIDRTRNSNDDFVQPFGLNAKIRINKGVDMTDLEVAVMEKMKVLPVQVIYLIDGLKAEVRAIAVAKTDADREKARETALFRMDVINTAACDAAEEAGKLL